MLKHGLIVFALVATVALPFLLRPKKASSERADEALVIITPHNEAIRHEFAQAFRKWYRARTGKTIFVDWRVIGGTSEIARFLEGEYTASFQNHWTNRLGKPWSNDVQVGFANPRLPQDASPLVQEARETFLKSNVGCRIDLFFGGGTYDFIRQAQAGRLVDSGVIERHPEWFGEAIIPQRFAGEDYWDPEGRWVGTVLSAYGIVFNRDSLKRLGFPGEPTSWEDLKDPRLLAEVALADPTKSGSIAKAFENVIQQQMQRTLVSLQASVGPGGDAKALENRAVSEGWLEGLKLLQLIGANARYFTDTSQKPPIDVATGNCAVGMCIDFYGRQQEEAVRRRARSDRVGYISPVGGTVSSVDPIALLRGAPNRAAAEAFIDFSLSMEGQKLWNFRPGTSGGPDRFALRRLPVRRDFYTEASWRDLRSDPTDAPFDSKDQLIYHPSWTGSLFREMSFVIRVMCLDTHLELTDAWKAILAAPTSARPEAMAILQNLSAIGYEETSGRVKQALNSKNKVDEIALANELGQGFRRQYREAATFARAQTP